MKYLSTCLLACLTGVSTPLWADPNPSTDVQTTAQKSLEARALEGDAEAQFELAMLYYQGQGVAKDKNKGLAWLTRAAENNHTKAQWYLGSNVYGGAGQTDKQIHWLKLAAAKDDTVARLAAADLAEALYKSGQIDEALAVYRKLSQVPSSRYAAGAMLKLGFHYARQSGDSAQKQSFDWFKKAADLDNDQAQFATGMGYFAGRGTAMDKSLAAEYFRRAANAGLAEAQYTLATLYMQGSGVGRDAAQGEFWFRKAAEQGLAVAQFFLCQMYIAGDGVPAKPEQGFLWCRKAAEQGDDGAQYALGQLYESGVGVTRDDALAAHWYAKAAAQNFPDAERKLARIKRGMSAQKAGAPIEPKMIAVPAGEFLMGSPSSESGRGWWESTPRPVKVAAFELAEHEVTFAEWDACVADGGCQHQPADQGWGRGTRPVINVNLADIEQYLDWLNKKTGKRYRLPTDAEWEYAARAGTTTPFSTGTCLTTEKANYKGYLKLNGCPEGVFREKTLAVKSFPANAWGFFDMHGNVAERTQDCFQSREQPNAKPDCRRRAIRGGSWMYAEAEARSGFREFQPAELRYLTLGFRLAR